MEKWIKDFIERNRECECICICRREYEVQIQTTYRKSSLIRSYTKDGRYSGGIQGELGWGNRELIYGKLRH